MCYVLIPGSLHIQIMLICLRLSALLRYPHCLSVTVTPGPSRSLMTGAARASQLKKVNSAVSTSTENGKQPTNVMSLCDISRDGVSTSTENSEVSTSVAARAKYHAKTGGYGLLIFIAMVINAAAAWTILKVWKL